MFMFRCFGNLIRVWTVMMSSRMLVKFKDAMRDEMFHFKVATPHKKGKAQHFVDSEDDVASEAQSHYSSTSDVTSLTEDVMIDGADEQQASVEEYEEKLRTCIDNMMDKSSTKTRQSALESLRCAFSQKLLSDFLSERKMTITDSLERCLKKGKGEEQSLAAAVVTLLVLQLGSAGEAEQCFLSLRPVLASILGDPTASMSARQSCATSLAMCCYLATDDIEEVANIMACLEGVFVSAYPRGNGNLQNHGPARQALHCTALNAWALLLTVCPPSFLQNVLESHLPKLPTLLTIEDVNIRIVAGELIALLFELAIEGFQYGDLTELCHCLRDLATDGTKSRAKAERRRQRSIFRDVLKGVEEGEAPSETVRFGSECISVDSWVRRRTYHAFREALGSGVCRHLQQNELVRDIFELGPPLLLDGKSLRNSKLSRFERHWYNSAAFKARTKARGKMRDKRADVL
uniref:interferon-related developmental regulator 2-like isoform X3 n=1 Tax=Myxine glutinosa TaxID=7769 RepID=UPI00359003BB